MPTTVLHTADRQQAYDSLSQAVAAAAELRAVRPALPLRFELSDGKHRLDTSLVLTAELSGSQQSPTVFAAATGATPVISGARRLELDWHPGGDGIWSAEVDCDGIDQLWIDGLLQTRARYPNADPGRRPFDGTPGRDALSPERVASWANPAGGELHALHAYRWGSTFARIEGKAPDGTLILGPLRANNRVVAPDPSQPHPELRYVENIFEELDAPGEWFFDPAAHRLFVIPTADIDLPTAVIEASALCDLIALRGTPDAPVHDIVFEGLRLTQSARAVLQADERILRSDWAISRTGAINAEGVERLQVRNCTFVDLGGNGVFIGGYARQATISACDLTDLGGSGVQFAGRSTAVRSPVVGYYNGLELDDIDRTPGPAAVDYPSDCVVDDCVITRIGRTDKQAAGVAIDIAARIRVSHCSIYDLPRAGINIGTGAFGGHLIEHNDVFDTVQETNDHGSFNSWGRDRYWHPELDVMRARVADDPGLALLDAVEQTVLSNNRWRCDSGFDIDLDDGSSNYQITNNVLLNGGLKLREGFGRIATNNIIINNGLHPHVSFPASGDVFAHNIVMGPYQPILVPVWDAAYDHNVFSTRTALDGAQELGSDAHSISGDPMFADADAGDYTIADDSPAHRVGFTVVAMDFGVRTHQRTEAVRTPNFPPLLSGAHIIGTTYDLSGAEIKSIETVAEQSAVGSDDQGVLVVGVAEDSPAAEAGLQPYDVIKSVELDGNQLPVADAPELLVLGSSRAWAGHLCLRVLRDHHVITIELALKH